MIKLSARNVRKVWDEYVATCNMTFGAPSHHVAGLAADLATRPAQIRLAAKFLLSEAYVAGELRSFPPFLPRRKSQPTFSASLKYVPRFVNDAALVASLNTSWARRSRGEAVSEGDNKQLDDFLREANRDGERIVEDCTVFVQKVKATISKKDPLFFHKTCILLGVDYDEPSPSLGWTILWVLFPGSK